MELQEPVAPMRLGFSLHIGLERRGWVKRSHDRGNWEQEDFDACDRQTSRSTGVFA